MPGKPKPAAKPAKRKPSARGVKKPSARSRSTAAFGASGAPSMTNGNWTAFFALVRKLLAAERELGAFVATDQMRIAANERGATDQLHGFMNIYR